MMKRIMCACIALVALAALAHQSRRTETLNWRCDKCHTAYRRVTEYVWAWDGYAGCYRWCVVNQTKCPGCGR